MNDRITINELVERVEQLEARVEELSKRTRITMRKPTADEVLAYMQEIRVPDAFRKSRDFFDYYESKGWKVGNTPMRDWKAACRKWCNSRWEVGAPTVNNNSAEAIQRRLMGE
jgi:hypothetical protein